MNSKVTRRNGAQKGKVDNSDAHKNTSSIPKPRATEQEDSAARDIPMNENIDHSNTQIQSNRHNSGQISSLKEMKEKIMDVYEERSTSSTCETEIAPEYIGVHSLIQDLHNNDNKSRVEAILFASGKYIEDEVISSLCEIDKRSAHKALEELRKDYESKQGALAIFQEGNSWKINVRERYLSLVRKIVADTELSKSVMETLAVIAWKSPIFQSEAIRIRGNKAYDHIEELETAGFITKDKKGRSYILKTAEKFYNYFDVDQKNLKGVMGEIKQPEHQATLMEEKKEEPEQASLIEKIQSIKTRSIVHTPEEKEEEQRFLETMRSKIVESAKRTDEYTSGVPRPMHEEQERKAESINDMPDAAAQKGIITDTVKERGENIEIDTGSQNPDHHFQRPEEQPQKQKSLTKKQLEKKFQNDLKRVKEKQDKK